MVHTVVWRVGSADALEFWADRLSAEGHEVEADGQALRFENPEGLAHELVVSQVADEPLVAHHPEIPHGGRAAGLRRRSRLRSAERRVPDGARVRAAGRPLGHARGHARRLDRVRRGAPRARRRRRRHRPPRRVGLDDGGRAGVARPRRRGGRPADADHRPLLVPLDLLPRADRRPVRDRDAGAGLRGRRGSRAPRREAHPAAGLRAPPRPRRAGADAAAGPAGGLGYRASYFPGSGSEDVSTTSKSAPVRRPSVWRASFDQCRFGAPETYQGEPLSARIIP